MQTVNVGRLLIVDDETGLAAALREILSAHGYETEVFASGKEALEALKERDFDLLLTDLMMPEIDGIALLRAALAIDPRLVGIIMTGQGTVQTAVDAMKVGAFDYILKPFKSNALLPVISRAMDVRRLRLENMELHQTLGIYELGQTISYTLDLNAILGKVTDGALQQCDADEASILLPTREGNELYVAAVRGEDREQLLGQRVAADKHIAGWVALHREPLVLRGRVDDPRFTPLSPRGDIQLAISMPLMVGGKLAGILNLSFTKPRRSIALGELKALSILTAIAGSALESARLHTEVRIAEEKYRSIFENAIEGIFQTGPDGERFTTVNAAMARILGYDSPEELMSSATGIGGEIFLDPACHTKLMRMLETQDAASDFECECRRRDGTVIWVSFNVHPVRDAGGKLQGYEGTTENITERKRAEEERGTALLRQEGVNLLQQSLLAPAPLDQKLKNITDSIVRLFDADFCRIWLILPGDLCEQGCIHAGVREGPHVCRSHDRCLHLLASSGRYTHTNGNGHRRVPFGCCKIGRVASGEEHKLITNDVQNGPLVHDRDWARNLGLVSFAGYQLRVPGKETLGVLALFARHPIASAEDAILDGLSSTAALVVQQAAADEAVRNSEARYHMLFEASADGILIADSETKAFRYANPALCRMLGYTEEELRTMSVADIHPKDALAGVVAEFEAQVRKEKALAVDIPCLRKDGTIVYADINSVPIRIDDAVCNVGFFRDTTERRVLEAQLLQAQKMEAVGLLAGGIAHDFNNILTAIIGYSTFLQMKMKEGDSLKHHADQIIAAAQRAARLTQSLLTFSRKQIINPKPIDLNDIIRTVEKFLIRIIGEDIELKTALTEERLIVMADGSQVEQLLMNLATNARDAMPEGGLLTISTSRLAMDAEFIKAHGYGKPGPSALISVEDTGIGMDRKTQEKIFEPFFTTKEVGKGTGLGLSIAYGIVKQHNGYINLYSEPEKGTTFRIYFPITQSAVEKAEPQDKEAPRGGTETILLGEDDPAVRQLTRIILEQFGYTVIEALDGEEAVAKFTENQPKIRLLLLDIVMPKKSGKAVSEEIKKMGADVRVLYTSGYTANIIHQKGILEEGLNFITKPFAPRDLLRKVREVLDQ
jgi:PAS domain S-box-containing protein